MIFSAFNIPHPKPGCPKGEDYIVIKKRKNFCMCLLIDGVSGSSVREGPKETWIQCRDFVISFAKMFKKAEIEHLPNMINKTLVKTRDNFPEYQGTFVFVSCIIYQTHDEYICNLCYAGDSTCYVVRDKKIYYKSKPTFVNKSMNVPMQIGVYERRLQKASLENKVLRLRKDDKIILCSDGVTDNLSDSKIICCKHANEITVKAKKQNKKRDDISSVVIIL